MEALNKLVDKIKAAPNSEAVVREIVELIRHFAKESRVQTAAEAINWLRRIGGTIRQECPNSFPILNILNRAITVLRESNSKQNQAESKNDQKLFRMMSNIQNSKSDQTESNTYLFSALCEEINSFDTINEEVALTACDHLEEKETLLVYCQSDLMWEFIDKAIEEKKVTLYVVVAEERPEIVRKPMREITYIGEASVFSVISKVNKVFMDCHAIMADGNVINAAGTFTTVAMAQKFSIPVFVLSPTYRFTPYFAFTQFGHNDFTSPHKFFKGAYSLPNLEVIVPRYDVIPFNCVSLVITQNGEFSSDSISRAFAEVYEDAEKGYEF